MYIRYSKLVKIQRKSTFFRSANGEAVPLKKQVRVAVLLKMKINFFLIALLFLTTAQNIYAACGATNLTWDGSSSNTWGNAANWTPANIPDTNTENALIPAAARNTRLGGNHTLACVTISSGIFEVANNTARTLTITGDYFSAPNLNSINFTATSNITFSFTGASPQTLTVVDPINYVNLGGNSTLTITESHVINRGLTFTGSTSGTVRIQGDLDLTYTTLTTIPTGITVIVESGASLSLAGSLTVNGSLIINSGAFLAMPAASTLTVASAGVLQLNGASGDVASIKGKGTSRWDFNMAGNFSASYFRIERAGTGTVGMNITGTVSSMNNGEFNYINSSGFAMTWGASATLVTTMNDLGFFDDSAFGNNRSINATAYTGSVVALDQWSGLGCTVEGCAFETDPSNKADWQLQAGVALTLSTNTNSGKPVATTVAGAVADEWVIFSFNLNQVSPSTDITQVTFTMTGTADANDVDYIRVYNQAGTCQTRGTQIGSDLVMTGSPATATLSIPAATVTTNGSAAACIHVWVKTTDTADDAHTLGIEISGTADVTNSAGYNFSPTSGPPVGSSLSTISGDPTAVWDGSSSTAWRTNANWNPNTFPTNTRNCRVGSAVRIITLTANEACQNMTLLTGGTINFNSIARILDVTGALDIQTGFIFQTATLGTLRMAGTSSQSMAGLTAFPGNMIINNTAAAGQVVSTDNNVTVNGNLTVQDGHLRISTGHTLTVLGNVTVNNGAILDIESGGTLKLGNNSVLTIDPGGTFEIIGAAQNAVVNATAPNAYTVVVNGTIKATKYTFSNLGINGVTINSGATIDATNYLQEGTFTYPQNNNTNLLRLFKEIPGNTLSSMTFSMGGSAASQATIKNITTNVAPASLNTLAVSSFSGDLGGPTYESETGYPITWAGETNDYTITLEATAPATVNQGATYEMGRFGFQQTAGILFPNMNLTSIKISLYGTGSSTDVTQVKLRNDINCDGAAESDLATGTLSGSPATVTFSGLSFTVEGGLTPTKRCIIVSYTVAAGATGAKTIGATIAVAGDIVNDQGFTLKASTPAPRELGTSSIIADNTNWTGTVSNVWTNASNWSDGLPSATINCNISSVVNNPVISSGIANCKTLNVTNGNLTIAVGATLQLNGSLTSTGTVNNSGTIEFVDSGVTTSQPITWTSGTAGTFKVSGTASTPSTVSPVTSSLTLNNLQFNAGTTHIVEINANTVTVSNGVTINAGTLRIMNEGTLQIASGQTLTVSGGTLSIQGVEQPAPQTLSNKGKIMPTGGAGTWTFNATSGTVYLSGFLLENLDVNGLQINGTANLTRLAGGQFRNLSNSYSSVKAIQLNTTGTVVATSTNVGWEWGPNNTYPANTESYKIVSSSGNGCSSGTIDFTGWFGDWYENTQTFDVSTKLTQSNCTINFAASASPVSLLSFTATPYNASVDLNWETALEQDHKGFNVFRANSIGSEFVQINSGLVRNLVGNTSTRGKYRFIDNDVNNGNTYFYYIEDVGSNGAHRELHGPVNATPQVVFGNPPATAADTNDGGLANDNHSPSPGAGTIINPSYKDFGNGIVILSQTSTGLRLWITPPAISYSASAWNGAYQNMSMNGYSLTDTAGHPELLVRTLLIEVNPWTTQASVTNITKTEANQAGHAIAPAAAWALNGAGVLTPTYTVDAAAYSINSYLPANPVEVESTLVTQGGRKFLKVVIYPARYNAAQEIVKLLTEAVVDIGLVGDAWDAVAPNNDFTSAPESISGTLQVAFNSSGVYQFTYDDLVDSNVEGPFVDIQTSDLRAYLAGEEIPLLITSGDGIFNTGDSVQFYVEHQASLDDLKNVVVFANRELMTSGSPAKRLTQVDGDPTAVADNAYQEMKFVAVAEENNLDFFSDPFATGRDHFFWGRIFAPYPTLPALEYLNIPISMPGHAQASTKSVTLKVFIKGNRGNISDMIYQHHVGIWVNNVPFMVADSTWIGEEYQILSFNLPSSYFHSGNNNVRVKSLGTYALAGDYDVMLVDKLEAHYWGDRSASSNSVVFQNYEKDTVVEVNNFTSNDMVIYDISNVYNTFQVINGAVSSDDGNVTYKMSFNTVSAGNSERARRYIALTPAAFKTPTAFIPTYGRGKLLKDSDNLADVIVIGPQSLLFAVQDWSDYREEQGLDVEIVSLEQIYAEFNNGVASSNAVKEFIQHALSNWTTPLPQYLLLVGDATYDPKDHLGYAPTSPLWPMPIVLGRFYDFGSDNWFASTYEGVMPQLAVGRLPFTQANQISDYLQKVMDYESGDRAPTTATAKNVIFISDSDTSENENFNERAAELAALTSLSDNGLITSNVERDDAANNAAFNATFINLFADAPLLMTFIGHGAEDRIAHLNVFSNSHASALTNTRLPIMLALNCLNAGFYNADPSIVTISETLLANRDGGAVAFIGSTSMTTPSAQMNYANEFFNSTGQLLGQASYDLRLGDIFMRAKTALSPTVYNTDVIESYSLIGDPTLVIPSNAFTPQVLPATTPTPFSDRPSAASSGGGGCSLGASEGHSQSGAIPWQALEWPMWFMLLFAIRWSMRKWRSNSAE